MSVELLAIFGNDSMVVDVARASFDKEASNYTTEQNDKLIYFLAKGGKSEDSIPHWSPFAHPKLQFRLTIPIYVERQIVKTQVGVDYNSISGRYVDFSDTYTKIEQFRKQSKDSKQGSAEDFSEHENDKLLDIQEKTIILCKAAYDAAINLGCSKEQARSFPPLSLNTTMIWTGSLYAFIRLCKQRLKADAQAETRTVVQEMLDKVLENNSFKESMSAYGYTSK